MQYPILYYATLLKFLNQSIPSFVSGNTRGKKSLVNLVLWIFVSNLITQSCSLGMLCMCVCVSVCVHVQPERETWSSWWWNELLQGKAPKHPSNQAQLPWKSNQAKFSSGNNFCLKLVVCKLEHHKLAPVDHWTGWKFTKTAWSSSSSSLVNPQLPFPNPQSSILNPNPNPTFNPYPIFNPNPTPIFNPEPNPES